MTGMTKKTTREDVETLLSNFADYVNPGEVRDPWFTLAEINQQFAWEDVPVMVLRVWLDDLVTEGKVQFDGEVWRWLS